MHDLDLPWTERTLLELTEVLQTGTSADLVDTAVELAAVLEVGAELVTDLEGSIATLRADIAAIDAHRAQREEAEADKPVMLSRRLVPWQLRRQALAWVWRPYTVDPRGLTALAEYLEGAALDAHREATRLHGAAGAAPLVRQRLLTLARGALTELRSSRATVLRATRCVDNLDTVRRALAGEVVARRPLPLEVRAPDPFRAAARAVVPLAAREAALSWLWEPHLRASA